MDDNEFGPRLPGHFDFTLLFEHSFFEIAPSGIVICATPFYVWKLFFKTPIISPGVLLPLKILAAAALVGAQAASIGLWQLSDLVNAVTDAATIMSCIAAVCIAVIVFVSHMYSTHSSRFLGFYLTLTMLLDIATTISYFNRDNLHTIASVHVAVPALKIVIMALEEISKRSLVRDKEWAATLGQGAFAGFWNTSLLVWINTTLFVGFRTNMSARILPGIDEQFDSETLYREFSRHWAQADKSSKYALFKACAKTVPSQLAQIILPRSLSIGFTLAQPFLLQTIVNVVSSQQISIDVMRGLVIATALIYVGRAVSIAWFTLLRNHITACVRGVLISAIYHKTLRLGPEEAVQAAAITLMSADVSSVEKLVSLSSESWARVFEFGFGLAILAFVVGAASIFTLFPTIIAAVLSVRLSQQLAGNRRRWNEHIENRVAAASNMLAQMKDIKMLGLGPIMARRLQSLVEAEIDVSMIARNAMSMAHALVSFAETLTPILVIAATLFWTQASKPISAARFYTVLAIIRMVCNPLAVLIQTMPDWATGFASLARIQAYLLQPEFIDKRRFVEDGAPLPVDSDDEEESTPAAPPAAYAMQLRHTSVTHDIGGAVLRDISLRVPIGSITMLIGAVGAGKTTLLRMILGEVMHRSGSVCLSTTSVGYCSQRPWIRDTTIRNNVVGSKPFNRTLYDRVMRLCALDVDLSQLPDGDETICGPGGSNLSGGQQQRIALARALYFETEILILDDVFSALDMVTSSDVRVRLFGQGGITEDGLTTVVMTTSTQEHLADADYVFELHQGRLYQKPVGAHIPTPTIPTGNVSSGLHHTPAAADGTINTGLPSVTKSTKRPEEDEPVPAARFGDFSLYRFHLGPVGLRAFLGFMCATVIGALGERWPQIFVKIWLDNYPTNRLFFIGYALFCIVNPVLNFLGNLAFFYLVICTASKELHRKLAYSVTGCTWDYFASQDAGSILNRFGQDLTSSTQVLPLYLLPSIWIGFTVLIEIGIIASGASYAAPIIPFFLFIIYMVQYFYLRTSRQLRVLELQTTETLVKQFTETSGGLEHVRTFHWEDAYVLDFYAALNIAQKPFYLLLCIQQWLATVMNLSTAFGAVIIVSLALRYSHTTSSTTIGLALLNLISFSETSNMFIRCFVGTETAYGGVARIRAFTDRTPIEGADEQHQPVDELWPFDGKIEFRQAGAVYQRRTGPHVALANLNLTVQPGQTIGLVGRTGSGKSSVFLSLLRLINYSGSIKIDGVELKTVQHDLLRARITTITQSPLELTGTVRFNLDPFDFCSRPGDVPNEETLCGILRRVGLWNHVALRGGLDANMSVMLFSQGQKQLLQLGRAVLHQQVTRSKIVMIDEGTGSMDAVTEQRMQTIMGEAFVGCTRLVISHRPAILNSATSTITMDHGVAYQNDANGNPIRRGDRYGSY